MPTATMKHLKNSVRTLLVLLLVSLPCHAASLYPQMFRVEQFIEQQGVRETTTVFVGDSRIARMYVNAVEPESLNYGIPGSYAWQTCSRAKAFPSSHTARAWVVAVGTNDIYAEGYDLTKVTSAITCIAQNVTVPLVFVGLNVADDGNEIHAQRIGEVNQSLHSVCEARSHCQVVDSPFTNPDGTLQREYFQADGVHNNPAGYAVLVPLIKQALEQSQQ